MSKPLIIPDWIWETTITEKTTKEQKVVEINMPFDISEPSYVLYRMRLDELIPKGYKVDALPERKRQAI
jgi:hypothetical protein